MSEFLIGPAWFWLLIAVAFLVIVALREFRR